jgi:hypothetical protein
VSGQTDPYVKEVRNFLENRTMFSTVVSLSTKEKILVMNKESKYEQNLPLVLIQNELLRMRQQLENMNPMSSDAFSDLKGNKGRYKIANSWSPMSSSMARGLRLALFMGQITT